MFVERSYVYFALTLAWPFPSERWRAEYISCTHWCWNISYCFVVGIRGYSSTSFANFCVYELCATELTPHRRRAFTVSVYLSLRVFCVFSLATIYSSRRSSYNVAQELFSNCIELLICILIMVICTYKTASSSFYGCNISIISLCAYISEDVQWLPKSILFFGYICEIVYVFLTCRCRCSKMP